MYHTKLIQTFETKETFAYMIKIFAGSLFLAVSAQISIPFYPVPMTLQALALMVLGLVCSPKVATGAVGLYLFEALIGLPVLSNFTGGAAHLFGTRGGFILAFLPLVLIVSYVSRVKNTVWHKVFACILGNIVLYTSGIIWLSQFTGFEKAIQFGLQPFLLQIPVYIALAIVSEKLIRKVHMPF